MRYFPVIDAVRFAAAMCVVLHHGVAVPLSLAATGIEWLPYVFGSIWFGRSAVIVFFIVSGFCVHGPFAGRDTIDKREFWARRYLRILIPLAAILPVAAILGVDYSPYGGWVTWTLVCEIVYYTAYPALRTVALCIGWPTLIGAGYVVGYASIAVSVMASDQIVAIAARDILANLPVWMLGCWVAEVARRGPALPSVWVMRPIAFTTSFTVGFAHYSSAVHLDWTSPAFGAVAALWLFAEVRRDAPFRLLSKGGAWSYSLYLVHPVAIFGIAPSLFKGLPIPIAHVAIVAVAPLISYIFFVAVERPSHRFARRMAAVSKTRAGTAIT